MSTATIQTSMGAIELELFAEDAPKTVENFSKLAGDGFYDGLVFHRVIPDFMIQGGCPRGDGTGDAGYKFEDEINDHAIVRGTLAMANAGPNTNGSQFFIVTADATPWLDGKHTAFGQVTAGQDVVDAISGVDRDGRRPAARADHDGERHHLRVAGGRNNGVRPRCCAPLDRLLRKGAALGDGLRERVLGARRRRVERVHVRELRERAVLAHHEAVEEELEGACPWRG